MASNDVKAAPKPEPKGVEELSKALAESARDAKDTLKKVLESEAQAKAAQDSHKYAVQRLNDLKARLDEALAEHLKVE
jgi:hypothetical protein